MYAIWAFNNLFSTQVYSSFDAFGAISTYLNVSECFRIFLNGSEISTSIQKQFELFSNWRSITNLYMIEGWSAKSSGWGWVGVDYTC